MTDANALSVVLVALMKGIADREADPALWQSLTGIQARVRDYVAVLGLEACQCGTPLARRFDQHHLETRPPSKQIARSVVQIGW